MWSLADDAQINHFPLPRRKINHPTRPKVPMRLGSHVPISCTMTVLLAYYSILGLLAFLIFLKYLNLSHSLRASCSELLDSFPTKGLGDFNKVRLVENIEGRSLASPRECQGVARAAPGCVDWEIHMWAGGRSSHCGRQPGAWREGETGPWMRLPVKNAKGSKNSKFKAGPLEVVRKDYLSRWEDRKYYMNCLLAQFIIVKHLDRTAIWLLSRDTENVSREPCSIYLLLMPLLNPHESRFLFSLSDIW